ENLDKLPFPARELIDLKRYCPSIGFYKRLPNATIVGSRGCNYNCLFCHTQTMGRKVRYRSAENIINEIKEVIREYKVRDILFWDNNLTGDKERIFKLCQEILKQHIKISWSGNTRADTVDEGTLKMMKKAGCRRLLLGVESGVQKNLNMLRKGETLEQIEQAVKLCKRIGIEIFATFMFAIPGETYEQGLLTIKFACRLNPEYAKFFTLACHPGTDLYQNIIKYGTLVSFTAGQSHQNAGFIPYTMKREEVKKLLNMAYRRFYLRVGYILMKILKIRSFEDLRQDIRGFWAFINTPQCTN
ncbi:MAG: radical SAM protein, partial [Candidatus Omnitrophota bacterium]